MPDRYRRVLYRELPEGQTWMITDIDGEQVIIISEALDAEGRKAARKAARASIRNRGLALIPLPVIASLAWLRDRANTPIGAAVMASTVTMAGGYALTEATRPAPVASPPVVVTLTPKTTTRTTSPRPTRTQATRTHSEQPPRRESVRPAPSAPAPTRAAPSRAARSSQPPPARTTRPPRDADRPPTQQEPPRAQPTVAGTSGTSAPASTPGPEPTRTPPPVAEDPPATDPPAPAGRDCGGIHVGVPLDPLLNLDVCLLD